MTSTRRSRSFTLCSPSRPSRAGRPARPGHVGGPLRDRDPPLRARPAAAVRPRLRAPDLDRPPRQGPKGPHPLHPADARPRRHLDHPDLQPGLTLPAAGDPHRHPPRHQQLAAAAAAARWVGARRGRRPAWTPTPCTPRQTPKAPTNTPSSRIPATRPSNARPNSPDSVGLARHAPLTSTATRQTPRSQATYTVAPSDAKASPRPTASRRGGVVPVR